MSMKKYFYPILASAALFAGSALRPAQAKPALYTFENLGKPVRFGVSIQFVTRNPETGPIAWTGLTSARRSALVGINVKTGKLINVDLTPYGKGNGVALFKKNDNTIYIYAGRPGRYFRYDVATGQLTTLGEPSNATYWMTSSQTETPDGKIYMGTFPGAAVSVLDTKTDTTKIIDGISDDPREEYTISLAHDKEGMLYFGLGMHHSELWSYNPKTGAKQQILPKELQLYGAPRLWMGKDGNPYGRKGSTFFRCYPDRIEIGDFPDAPGPVLDREVHGKIASGIGQQGNLILNDPDTEKTTIVKSTFDTPAHSLFRFSDLHDGKLYGSSFKPGTAYSFDIHTKKLENLGLLTRGRTQVYDFLSYGDGILMSSYGGGFIDYYKPNEPRSATNPLPVAALHEAANQERPVQLTLGPDGNIYSPTFPIKGYLGGTLVRITPKTWKVKIYKDLIHNQSFTSVVSVPQTGELFVTSTIHGGSSSKPTEKEAWVFLWDPKMEKIDFKAQPIPGASSYSKAAIGANGLIYGFAGTRYYVFNPATRKIVATGDLPGYTKDNPGHEPLLSDGPASDGLIYGIDRDLGNLFAIDPKTNEITNLAHDESMITANFCQTEPDGYLYYNNGASLLRVKVVK